MVDKKAQAAITGCASKLKGPPIGGPFDYH